MRSDVGLALALLLLVTVPAGIANEGAESQWTATMSDGAGDAEVRTWRGQGNETTTQRGLEDPGTDHPDRFDLASVALQQNGSTLEAQATLEMLQPYEATERGSTYTSLSMRWSYPATMNHTTGVVQVWLRTAEHEAGANLSGGEGSLPFNFVTANACFNPSDGSDPTCLPSSGLEVRQGSPGTLVVVFQEAGTLPAPEDLVHLDYAHVFHGHVMEPPAGCSTDGCKRTVWLDRVASDVTANGAVDAGQWVSVDREAASTGNASAGSDESTGDLPSDGEDRTSSVPSLGLPVVTAVSLGVALAAGRDRW